MKKWKYGNEEIEVWKWAALLSHRRYPPHVPFKPPNHKTKGMSVKISSGSKSQHNHSQLDSEPKLNHSQLDSEPKLNVQQNREILKAFFTRCPDRFSIEG